VNSLNIVIVIGK